jgi:myo-inositol-1(or 4)-monophosphatase
VHSYPYVSISLGLSIDFTPYIGVVYNPFTGQLYTGIKGHGAFLTTTFPGQPTSEPRRIEQLPLRQSQKLGGVQNAQLAVEWGTDRSGNDMAVKSNTFARLARSHEGNGAMVHSLRSFGSAALNLCGVASGGLEAYWEAGCWAWDVCAGWCILAEAGGVMVGANPEEWQASLEGRRYFAVRGDGEEKENKGGLEISVGQSQFIEEFWGFVEGKFEVGS